MGAGKQAETVIVHWHPGDSNGKDGSGITQVSVPTDNITTEQTARAAVNTRVSTLSARLVASGTLPVGV